MLTLRCLHQQCLHLRLRLHLWLLKDADAEQSRQLAGRLEERLTAAFRSSIRPRACNTRAAQDSSHGVVSHRAPRSEQDRKGGRQDEPRKKISVPVRPVLGQMSSDGPLQHTLPPGGINIFYLCSFPAVRFVMSTLLSRRTNSTIVEGQRLGTVHIMEGTCSGTCSS